MTDSQLLARYAREHAHLACRSHTLARVRATSFGRSIPLAEGTEAFEALRDAAIGDVIWSAVADGSVLSVTGNVRRVCGGTLGDLLRCGATLWADRAHSEDAARVDRAYRTLLLTGIPIDEEFRWRRFDDEWIWVRARGVLRAGAAEPTVDMVISDVSERRALEDQVRQLQKTAAVGAIAGGIAHDFNNLLAVILANLTMLIDAIDEGDPRRADAVAALDAASRAAGLTKRLLPFTRPHAFESRLIDLNEVVAGAEEMLRRIIGEDIELSIQLTPDLSPTRADPALLEQVLLNLVMNARDAMPEGGRLLLSTSMVTVGGRSASLHGGASEGRYVRLTVADTGCGMDAATRQRVFEPFFTTKPLDRGTGLGLATSLGIVRQVGGWIAIDSEPGKGSVFEVLLPAAHESSGLAAGAAAPAPADHTGDEAILVIEDDSGVRALVQRMLERLGYRVSCARDAEDALAYIRSGEGSTDLILSDVIMPGLNGAELVERIRETLPRVKVLFMSGHSAQSLTDRGVLGEREFFIHKPFTPGSLAKRVREVLDA